MPPKTLAPRTLPFATAFVIIGEDRSLLSVPMQGEMYPICFEERTEAETVQRIYSAQGRCSVGLQNWHGIRCGLLGRGGVLFVPAVKPGVFYHFADFAADSIPVGDSAGLSDFSSDSLEPSAHLGERPAIKEWSLHTEPAIEPVAQAAPDDSAGGTVPVGAQTVMHCFARVIGDDGYTYQFPLSLPDYHFLSTAIAPENRSIAVGAFKRAWGHGIVERIERQIERQIERREVLCAN